MNKMGRPRKKECECGNSIEHEWVVVDGERICIRCHQMSGIIKELLPENNSRIQVYAPQKD